MSEVALSGKWFTSKCTKMTDIRWTKIMCPFVRLPQLPEKWLNRCFFFFFFAVPFLSLTWSASLLVSCEAGSNVKCRCILWTCSVSVGWMCPRGVELQLCHSETQTHESSKSIRDQWLCDAEISCCILCVLFGLLLHCSPSWRKVYTTQGPVKSCQHDRVVAMCEKQLSQMS